jgi:tetratricopeptide (TPR) repeat protein
MAAFKWWISPPASPRRPRPGRPPRGRYLAPSLGLCFSLIAGAVDPASALALPNDACIKDERCKEHHDKAVSYYSQQYYDEALTEFQAAYAARQMPLLLINIGRTLQKLGRPKEALDYYERFQQAESKPDPAIAAKLSEYIAQAKALVGTTPPPPPTNPNQATDAAQQQAKQAPPVQPPQPPPPGRSLIIAGGVVAGLGLAGIIAGAGLYARSASDYSTFQNSQDELDQMAAKSSAQSFGLGSNISYGLGAAALIAGGSLITVGSLKLLKHRRAAATPAAQAALVPGVGGASMVLSGAF